MSAAGESGRWIRVGLSDGCGCAPWKGGAFQRVKGSSGRTNTGAAKALPKVLDKTPESPLSALR